MLSRPYREPQSVSLSKATLAKLVGQYRVEDQQTVILTHKAAQLFIQCSIDMPTQALVAVTPNEFAISNSMTRLRFIQNESGATGKLQFFDRGVQIKTAMNA